jgi:hypothetical protein
MKSLYEIQVDYCKTVAGWGQAMRYEVRMKSGYRWLLSADMERAEASVSVCFWPGDDGEVPWWQATPYQTCHGTHDLDRIAKIAWDYFATADDDDEILEIFAASPREQERSTQG